MQLKELQDRGKSGWLRPSALTTEFTAAPALHTSLQNPIA
jgi:hypothetical protein